MKSKVDADSTEEASTFEPKKIVCNSYGEPDDKRPNCPLKKKKVMKRRILLIITRPLCLL